MDNGGLKMGVTVPIYGMKSKKETSMGTSNMDSRAKTKNSRLAMVSLCLALLPFLVFIVWQGPLPVRKTALFILLTDTLAIVTGAAALLIIKRKKDTLRGKPVAILAIAISILFLLNAFLGPPLMRWLKRGIIE
ncbi:MAG: hypothetical protein ACYS30_15700 [Planctomycetota bacterium]|jgi:uncharacterized membrane protein